MNSSRDSNSACNIIYSILKHLIEKMGICFSLQPKRDRCTTNYT